MTGVDNITLVWQKIGVVTRDHQGFYSFAGSGYDYQDISEAAKALYECNIDQEKAS